MKKDYIIDELREIAAHFNELLLNEKDSIKIFYIQAGIQKIKCLIQDLYK